MNEESGGDLNELQQNWDEFSGSFISAFGIEPVYYNSCEMESIDSCVGVMVESKACVCPGV